MRNVSSKDAREELILLLKKGDQQAGNYLYDIYAGALYGIILQKITNRGTASIILQKTFAAIFQKIDLYDPNKERLFTWMLKIARNLSISMEHLVARHVPAVPNGSFQT